ncbi:class I SAM-dependent methyltransferase [Arcanobacterium pinnipediorum]|uniref:Class I SAM-dependent methyltransferase n=1 Tax=Arcanobacterium pinnipediorum TaxID=1503041 RepID=A0ABY5AGP1_9ACTO|nr:class I SAM-dependent methyltransferase [Arcanobacterium pinnipediorum]USR78661.1 class I SAM-dependent methyltransferase [Arcanobacterium pinnipediorum]
MQYGHHALSPTDNPIQANEKWWSDNAGSYLTEHGEILGDNDFIWGPEGVREADIGFLGELSDKRILEIGAGAAQCSRYLAARGYDVVATDLAPGMLTYATELNHNYDIDFPLIQADARQLPFPDDSFDVVFTSFGVLPFVPNLADVHTEVYRVLRSGGIWAYSALHPTRWMFPDDPTIGGLTAIRSYFDRTPYIERHNSTLDYAEFHHTLSDHINSLIDAGFTIDELFEPPWPAGRDIIWGGWGPQRSQILPGTLMIRAIGS